jgi:hypothetical protein
MGATAGFACVGCVKQALINSALRAVTAGSPAYTFTLPNLVTVGNTSVAIGGVLVATAPQVTLQANAGDLVSVDFGFAGVIRCQVAGDPARIPLSCGDIAHHDPVSWADRAGYPQRGRAADHGRPGPGSRLGEGS